MNRYALWKYILIIVISAGGMVYALPNLYGSDPAVQISALRGADFSELTLVQHFAGKALAEAGIDDVRFEYQEDSLLARFDSEDTQIKAREVLAADLGPGYIIALNLAPATPSWLAMINAEPMNLGLDLRGGVHFLLQVDMAEAVKKAEEGYISSIKSDLRAEKIRYRSVTRRRAGGQGNPQSNAGGLLIRFRDAQHLAAGIEWIADNYPELKLTRLDEPPDDPQLLVQIREEPLNEIQREALRQNIVVLKKRVNELGVAEPIIQQQGTDRIVVQLPGVQDTARAKVILGATATLEFRMTDQEHDVQDAVDGRPPAGSRLYRDRLGNPVLLKKEIMLTGDYITQAGAGFDQASGSPNVSISLDGKGARIFADKTIDEVGKLMAVVFIENKLETIEQDGRLVQRKVVTEEVINQATIREQLGARFQITGLDSSTEANNLALLLRAGALKAPVYIIEERTVGPSLGQDNINKGKRSVQIGFVLVLIFMLIWYKVFGLAANLALSLNLVLIVALLSILPTTLTLPGIAGIVLTVGMAVDANVLIFQRIREEVKNGNSPQASIHAGYEKAFSTIADANITTLIAALVLFGLGTGPIKGFAVTLSLGIVCSMFTAIMVTRAIINLIYGGRRLTRLSI